MAKTNEKIILGVLLLFLILSSSTLILAINSGNLFGKEEAKKAALRFVPGEVQEVEIENEDNQQVYEVDVLNENGNKEVTINQQGEVIGVEDEELDIPITGNALEKASKAALDYIGEGRVTDSEVGDEEGYYEIEITLDNGREVDVHLDENFRILSTEYN